MACIIISFLSFTKKKIKNVLFNKNRSHTVKKGGVVNVIIVVYLFDEYEYACLITLTIYITKYMFYGEQCYST